MLSLSTSDAHYLASLFAWRGYCFGVVCPSEAFPSRPSVRHAFLSGRIYW